jgi:hypothetical protein
MRILFRLLVSLVTFTIGVSIFSLWNVGKDRISTALQTGPAVTEPEPAILIGRSTPPPRPEMHSCGPNGNYHTYWTEDDTEVSESNEWFHSAKKAQKEFAKRLASAKEIVQRGPVAADGIDQPAGERVVAVYGDHAAVITIRGASLESISAPSLSHLRESQRR